MEKLKIVPCPSPTHRCKAHRGLNSPPDGFHPVQLPCRRDAWFLSVGWQVRTVLAVCHRLFQTVRESWSARLAAWARHALDWDNMGAISLESEKNGPNFDGFRRRDPLCFPLLFSEIASVFFKVCPHGHGRTKLPTVYGVSGLNLTPLLIQCYSVALRLVPCAKLGPFSSSLPPEPISALPCPKFRSICCNSP